MAHSTSGGVENYEKLATAIIRHAVEDYKQIPKTKNGSLDLVRLAVQHARPIAWEHRGKKPMYIYRKILNAGIFCALSAKDQSRAFSLALRTKAKRKPEPPELTCADAIGAINFLQSKWMAQLCRFVGLDSNTVKKMLQRL
jgi:hypothetical protein